MFLFQKWLGSPFPEDVWAWWLLMHWLQLEFTPCGALPSVWIGFASQTCGHPCYLCTFSYPISSFQSTLHLICFDTALLEQPPLSVMTLWLTLFVDGVNDRLLDHCQFSSVPHYCGFKEQETPIIYSVWMVIYWNSNVNILIFLDTDFWLSLAVTNKKHVMNLKYMKVSLFEMLLEKMNFFTIFNLFLDLPVYCRNLISCKADLQWIYGKKRYTNNLEFNWIMTILRSLLSVCQTGLSFSLFFKEFRPNHSISRYFTEQMPASSTNLSVKSSFHLSSSLNVTQ